MQRSMWKLGCFGNSWSPKIIGSITTISLDRAHTTSYSTSVETIRLSCIYRFRVICQKSPILTYPTGICLPVGGDPSNLADIIGIIKIRVTGLSCGVFLRDSTTQRLAVSVLMPTCDGRTDRHTTTVYIPR